MRRRRWSCTLIAFCLASLTHSQQATIAGTSAPEGPKSTAVSAEPVADAPTGGGTMRLDVVVTDPSGKPVSGLDKADFSLLDNNKPTTILSFRTNLGTAQQESPVEVILLIDTVNVSFPDVSYERKQLEKFLRQDDGKLPYPVSVDWVSEKGVKTQPQPLLDGNALANQLAATESGLRLISDDAGDHGLVERFEISIKSLDVLAQSESKRPGRKLVIWIGSGWPMLDGPKVDFSSGVRKALFNDIVELSTRLREARISLYSISQGQANFATFVYREYLKGVPNAEKATVANLSHKVLAEQSGGLVLTPSNDMATAIDTCIQDARVFYTVSFDPPPTDSPNEYHDLKVRIDKPGLAARTNTGFYNQPAAPNAP